MTDIKELFIKVIIGSKTIQNNNYFFLLFFSRVYFEVH